MQKIRSSEITPEHVYLSRRRFMRLGALALGSTALTACGGQLGETLAGRPAPAAPTKPADAAADTLGIRRDEFGDPANSFETISTYNNYYEFTEDKEGVAKLAANFKAEPWKVTVGGLVSNPRTYDIDDLRRKFDQEERIYRLRCVEGWSMVIPWIGFPLHKLLAEVQPKAEAKYVRFESLLDPNQYPNQRPLSLYPWPYTEGLRLDEAMHDLTLMVTGLYGKPLPNSNGAPLRLAVPWKYGFKSIKAIVKIELTAEQPKTLWNTLAPHEYGFYSNVNPQRPHPRWSQATERRIGESGRRPTLMFNGYADRVAGLYAGMDLQANY
ncbi:MAG: protein-methionine-sulfoxide reductase catalytic subunit MsrP [Chloroflexi bacterium]|jgi:sulfoxide reductase catalytic subunit YedY|uniref:Protein-methionine-sulfoxide reductase catalytic subunit MsrP n=1 Tax=Candidatus Thermofonsia Clade 3 bacterium TaxID=2364212 RepID=A0A2M8QFZ6_9CHLR|nr:protein-methionine-sulfoxide reductase catalytic subunit MsrP [Candidatus Roseilinea sp. NK_OTU-006]PJF48727.1 MAG: protein-methionine-sulfoxide reductase catalytic subunit MsrP [Candidatus Thermofonsia Clade 3 bacterium]RMG62906.1 MAG: protein-methionine-sulfoxide reductase catalytic subunit MsrP [Chloroflexota bacterium]